MPEKVRKAIERKKESANMVNTDEFNSLFMVNQSDLSDHDRKWIIDSGASCHLTYQRELLINERKVDKVLNLPDNSTMQITTVGDILLRTRVKEKIRILLHSAHVAHDRVALANKSFVY